MRRKFMIIFIFSIIVTLQSVTYASNWQWVVSTDTKTFEMDMSNLQKNTSYGTTYIKAWVRIIYNDAGVQEVLRVRKSSGLNTDGYENISHCVLREEFFYSGDTKKVRAVSWIDYDSKGKVLDSFSGNYVEWQEIYPDTIGEALFEKAYLSYNLS